MGWNVIRRVLVLVFVFSIVGVATASVADGRTGTALAMQENDGGHGAGSHILPEWWGLGGRATEAAFIGLVELGVTVLVIGVLGYSVGKRTGVVPPKYRLRLLKLHEGTMLVGVALIVPHVLFAEEGGGFGSLAVLFIGVEVVSGFYGRHLHRHVVRMGRGDATPVAVGSMFDMTNRMVFRRWRKIHVSLTVVTALVIVLHIVTAVGG